MQLIEEEDSMVTPFKFALKSFVLALKDSGIVNQHRSSERNIGKYRSREKYKIAKNQKDTMLKTLNLLPFRQSLGEFY